LFKKRGQKNYINGRNKETRDSHLPGDEVQRMAVIRREDITAVSLIVCKSTKKMVMCR